MSPRAPAGPVPVATRVAEAGKEGPAFDLGWGRSWGRGWGRGLRVLGLQVLGLQGLGLQGLGLQGLGLQGLGLAQSQEVMVPTMKWVAVVPLGLGMALGWGKALDWG